MPTNERNDSTAKLFISAVAVHHASPALWAAAPRLAAAASFMGSTMKPVTARIAAATNTNVDWKPV